MWLSWLLENFLSEIIFGLVLIPLILWRSRWLYDYFWKAPRIVRILSIHNNPTRTWRKGIYARDRFMEIYESGVALPSDGLLPYSGGDGGGAWHNEYLDKGILSKYNLVTVFEDRGQKKVKANNNRLAKLIYTRIKKIEQKEEKQRKDFVRGEGNLRNITR